MTIFHRVDRDITGNMELRAQTIAAFMMGQSQDRTDGIQCNLPMNSAFLHFIMRDRATRYWNDNGWIISVDDSITLTEAGLEKIRRSLSGEERGYNVSQAQVMSAANTIRSGSQDEVCISRDFDLWIF